MVVEARRVVSGVVRTVERTVTTEEEEFSESVESEEEDEVLIAE